MERSERNALRRQRAALRRKRDQKRGIIECRVWEQCLPAQDALSWQVVSEAVKTAVELTEDENISDNLWIARAIEILQNVKWITGNGNGEN